MTTSDKQETDTNIPTDGGAYPGHFMNDTPPNHTTTLPPDHHWQDPNAKVTPIKTANISHKEFEEARRREEAAEQFPLAADLERRIKVLEKGITSWVARGIEDEKKKRKQPGTKQWNWSHPQQSNMIEFKSPALPLDVDAILAEHASTAKNIR